MQEAEATLGSVSGWNLKKDSMVMFEKDSSRGPTLGLVTGSDGKRNLAVCDSTGRKVSIPLRSIRYALPGPRGYAMQDFERLTQRLQELQDDSLLQLAWDLSEPGDGVSPQGLADLVFGNTSPDHCYAAFCMLEGEAGKVYFRHRRDAVYEARPKQLVEESLAKQAAEAKRLERMGELAAQLKAVLKAGAGYARDAVRVEDFPPAQQEVLVALQNMAAKSVHREGLLPEAADQLAVELLEALGRVPTRGNALRLCQQLQLFGVHQNLWLWNSELSKPFPQGVLDEAEQLLQDPPPDPDAATRVDLTHLKTYAIDSADTTEVDDGVSLEVLPDGRERVWVHIADVSRWITEGSALDLEAQRRQQTLYIPEEVIPMFPMSIAGDLLSLTKEGKRYAVSLGAVLDSKGDFDELSLVASLVNVTYRLTYDEVDDMIYEGVAAGEEKELGRLLYWAEVRKNLRDNRGSVDRFQRAPQSTMKVKPDEEAEDGMSIKVEIDDPERASVRLVTELMILAGEGMGRFGAENSVPVPFRRQAAPTNKPMDNYLESLPEKYCQAQAMYRFMSPAEFASEPGRHHGMGLDYYVQWSSPIRRYNDLLVHYQFKKWLRKQQLLSGLEIKTLVQSREAHLGEGNKAARQAQQYWLLEFLRRNNKRTWEAYVLNAEERRDTPGRVMYTFLLNEIGTSLKHTESGVSLKPGETVWLQVAVNSARNGNTRIEWSRDPTGNVASPSPSDPPPALSGAESPVVTGSMPESVSPPLQTDQLTI